MHREQPPPPQRMFPGPPEHLFYRQEEQVLSEAPLPQRPQTDTKTHLRELRARSAPLQLGTGPALSCSPGLQGICTDTAAQPPQHLHQRSKEKYGTVQRDGDARGWEGSRDDLQEQLEPVPQPRVVTALRRPAGNRRREKLQTLCPARVRLPLPCKIPPVSSCKASSTHLRGPSAKRFMVPAAPRGKLRHAGEGIRPARSSSPKPQAHTSASIPVPSPAAPGAAQPEPRSPTAPDDPRVETSSPGSFPGLGSKTSKINLFPAG